MITIKIDEDKLLEILVDRVKYWTSDENVIALYRNYYEKLIDYGCFEGRELDIMSVVDNDYTNNLIVLNKEDFEDWGVESLEDDKIEAFNKEQNLYLVRTY